MQDRTHPHDAIGLGGVLAQADLTEALRQFNVPLNVVLPDSSPFQVSSRVKLIRNEKQICRGTTMMCNLFRCQP